MAKKTSSAKASVKAKVAPKKDAGKPNNLKKKTATAPKTAVKSSKTPVSAVKSKAKPLPALVKNTMKKNNEKTSVTSPAASVAPATSAPAIPPASSVPPPPIPVVAAKKAPVPEVPVKEILKNVEKVDIASIKSHLSRTELDHYRDLLLEKRQEILGDVDTMESEAFKQGSNLSNMPIHMADVGTDNFEQEFTLGLIESERKILREIQEALRRIDNNTYGICQGTGKEIPKIRLEAVPWAKYSLEYAKALESGQLSRHFGTDSDDDEEEEE